MGKFCTLMAWFIGLPSLIVLIHIIRVILKNKKADAGDASTVVIMYVLVSLCAAWILR